MLTPNIDTKCCANMGVNLKISCSQGFLVFACTWKCGQRSRCTHTMRARTCVSVVVCVARKLRPCPSYSGRRDRNNSVHWRSLYKGGGVTEPKHGAVRQYPLHSAPQPFSQSLNVSQAQAASLTGPRRQSRESRALQVHPILCKLRVDKPPLGFSICCVDNFRAVHTVCSGSQFGWCIHRLLN